MKTLTEMAQEAGFETMLRKGRICGFDRDGDYTEEIEALAELVRADTRNATLDEIAKKIEAMPFGDTAASFAVWIREQKT